MNRLLILDRDGTLNLSSTTQRYLFGSADFEWVPGVVDIIQFAQTSGVDVCVCTNQRGISLDDYPSMTRESVVALHERMNERLNQQLLSNLEFYFCPHDDSDDCCCRSKRSSQPLDFESARLHFGV